MYKSGQPLHNTADFDNAMYFGLNVIAWQAGEILDYGGIIESHNDEVVKIQGEYYIKRAACEFKVR